jgi:hypothetical protein
MTISGLRVVRFDFMIKLMSDMEHRFFIDYTFFETTNKNEIYVGNPKDINRFFLSSCFKLISHPNQNGQYASGSSSRIILFLEISHSK